MVDVPKTCPKACGSNGVPCGDPDCYPVCNTMGEEKYVLKEFLMFEKSAALPTFIILDKEQQEAIKKGEKLRPGVRPPIEKHKPFSELDDIIRGGFLKHRGYRDLCRSREKHPFNVARFDPREKKYVHKKEPHYRWSFRGGMASFLVHDNEYKPSMHALFRVDQNIAITLPVTVAYPLFEVLGLNHGNVCIAPGGRPAMRADGTYTEGTYFFVYNADSLKVLIQKLENRRVELINKGLDTARLNEVAGHLKRVKDKIEEPMRLRKENIKMSKEARETQHNFMFYSLLGTGLLIFFIGYHPMKDLIAKIRGRVKTTDFGKIIRERLKLDPKYDVLGRDKEARLGWGMTDSVRARHVIIDTPTGWGKDKVVEKMIIDKERDNPVVPERFRKAPVLKINAAEFQAQTSLRGNVADKVAEIAKMARKGPVILYISEIDLVFLSGGSASGDTEAMGKLMLDVLEDPAIKENLIIFGSTSRGQEMIARYPDLERRFNWMELREFRLSEIVDIIDQSTRRKFEKHYKVKITCDNIELAARMAEHYYRAKTGMPRFDAVETILEDAARMARDRGESTVAAEFIIGATEERCGETFDRAEIQDIVKADLDSLMVDVKPGEAVASQPAVSPEVAARSEAADYADRLVRASAWDSFGDAKADYMVEQLETNGEIKKLLEGVSISDRQQIVRNLGFNYWLRVAGEEIDKAMQDRPQIRIGEGGGSVALSVDWVKREISRIKGELAMMDQLRADPKLEGLFAEFSKNDLRELANEYYYVWESIPRGERDALINEYGVGREGWKPSTFIRSLHVRTSELLAGRGAKGVGREKERPEDRDRKARAEEAQKGEGVLDHALDPRKPHGR